MSRDFTMKSPDTYSKEYSGNVKNFWEFLDLHIVKVS